MILSILAYISWLLLFQVRLHKKSALRISKGSKNVLVIDTKAKKTPSSYTRKTLKQLYGENLGEITAMGRKKGSTRISEDDLLAIYGNI